MLLPYFFNDPNISNISINAKKKAQLNLYLNIDHPHLYVSNRVSRKEVIAFINPKTNLFVVKQTDKNKRAIFPNDEFRNYATITAEKFVTDFIFKMKELYDTDPDEYDKKYKPVKQLNQELSEYLEFRHDFYRNLQQQIDDVTYRDLPLLNEYLLFNDDKIDNFKFATAKLPYLNPQHQTLTDEQKQLVDNFLDVFLDEYNKKKLAWYFGAILSNVDMGNENISKAMIVTSNTGGTGKSTLINSLAKGLITNDYLRLYSGFDNYFNSNDKFATSSLEPCRLHVFSEAYFNGNQSKTENDFTGLDESNIKAWITEGIITTEEKYQPRKMSELSGMAIILTNTPPKIPAERKELTRRFISVVVKSSDMIEDKAKALDMNEQQIYQFIQTNAQAFANYFVSLYQDNPSRYQSLVYDYTELQDDINELNKACQYDNDEFKKLILSSDYKTALVLLSKKFNINIKPLFELMQDNNDNIRSDDKFIYINSTVAFFKSLDITQFRQILIDYYGQPIKKFHIRVFRIPRNK